MAWASKGNHTNIHICGKDYKLDEKEKEDGVIDIYGSFPDDFVFYHFGKEIPESKGKLK